MSRISRDDAQLESCVACMQRHADEIGETVYVIDTHKPTMAHVEPGRSPYGACASVADEWDRSNAVRVLNPGINKQGE